MKSEYRAIAHITRTHGRLGEVVAVSADGLPCLLREGMRVALVPPALKGSRFFTVATASDEQEKSGQLVQFKEVRDLNAAEKLVGKTILAQKDDLPDDVDLHSVQNLLGVEVIDHTAGSLGIITEVMSGPANDVWVIEGPYGEVLIPVVDAFIDTSIFDENLHTTLPEGYLSSFSEGE